jgi:hypothetical protein
VKRKYRYGYIYAAVFFIILVSIIMKLQSKREPITLGEFIDAMTVVGYRVQETKSLRNEESGDLYSSFKSNIVELDDESAIVYSYSARKPDSNTEVVFRIYTDEDAATKGYSKQENSKKLQAAHQDFTAYEQNSKNEIHRVGSKYSLYYTENLEGNYFLASRVGKTMIIAYIQESDARKLNNLFNELGYGINS